MENDLVRTSPQVWNFPHFFLTGSVTELTCNIRCWPGAVWATWAWARRTRLRRTWWRQPGWSQATERCRCVASHLHYYSSSFTATGAAGAGQEEEEEWRQGYGQQAGQNVQLIRSLLSFVPKIFDIYWTHAITFPILLFCLHLSWCLEYIWIWLKTGPWSGIHHDPSSSILCLEWNQSRCRRTERLC